MRSTITYKREALARAQAVSIRRTPPHTIYNNAADNPTTIAPIPAPGGDREGQEVAAVLSPYLSEVRGVVSAVRGFVRFSGWVHDACREKKAFCLPVPIYLGSTLDLFLNLPDQE